MSPELDALLHHDGFLRVLARALLDDAADADDVVQETWLVALRHANDRARMKRAWLAGVLRNLARRSIRDRERRRRREWRAARPEATPSVASLAGDAAAQAALRASLDRALRTLPEEYREVLRMRFELGLRPQAIARRLSIPDSTVRTRLQRALRRVRIRLERNGSYGLLPLLLARPPRWAPVAAILASAAAVVLLLVQPPGAARALRPDDAAPARTLQARARAARAAPSPPLATSGPAEASTPDTGRLRAPTLTGRVLLPDGARPRTVRLEASVPGEDCRWSAPVDADASFGVLLGPRFPERATVVLVEALHATAGAARVTVAVDRDARAGPRLRPVVIDLRAARDPIAPAGARGDADGPTTRPAPEVAAAAAAAAGARALGVADPGPPRDPASVALLEGRVDLAWPGAEGEVAIEVDAGDGDPLRFRVPAGAPFALPVAELFSRGALPVEVRVTAGHPRSPGARRSMAVLVDPGDGSPVLPPVALTLPRARIVRGVVRDGAGAPAADARLAIYALREGQPYGVPVAAARSDALGRFEAPVIPGRAWLLVAWSDASRPAAAPIAGDDLAPVELVLESGALLAGTVRRADGTPCAGAVVHVERAGEGDLPLELPAARATIGWDGARARWLARAAFVDDDGSWRAPGLEEGAHAVTLLALPSGLPCARASGTSARTAPGTCDLRAPSAWLLLRAECRGTPAADARLLLRALDEDPDAPAVALRTAVDGLVRVEVPAPGRVRIDGRAAGCRPIECDVDAPAEGATRAVDVAFVDGSDLGTAVVQPVPSAGVPLPLRFALRLWRDGDAAPPEEREATLAGGRLEVADLEPGAWLLEAWPGGRPPAAGSLYLPARAVVLVPAGAPGAVRLPLRAGGRLRVVLPAEAGPDPPPPMRLEGAAGPGVAVRVETGRTLLSDVAEPGDWTLVVGPEEAERREPVTLRAGEVTAFALASAR